MGTERGLRRRVKGLSEAEFRARFGTEAQGLWRNLGDEVVRRLAGRRLQPRHHLWI
jgi:hypothetical protein